MKIINMAISLIPSGLGDFLSSCSFDTNCSFTDFLVKKIIKYAGITTKNMKNIKSTTEKIGLLDISPCGTRATIKEVSNPVKIAKIDITKREYLAQFFLRIRPIPVKTIKTPGINKDKKPAITIGKLSLDSFKNEKLGAAIRMPAIII